MFTWPLFPEHVGGQAKTVVSHCLPEGVIRIACLSEADGSATTDWQRANVLMWHIWCGFLEQACQLKTETITYEEKEQQLVNDCVKELSMSLLLYTFLR